MDGMVTLATGHGAVIGRESGVHDAEWLIALDVTSGRTSATRPRRSCGWLRASNPIGWRRPAASCADELDRESGAVKAHEVDWYDEVVLREHPVAVLRRTGPGVLAEAWVAREPDEDSRRLLRRLRFAGLGFDLDALIATAAAAATPPRRRDPRRRTCCRGTRDRS